MTNLSLVASTTFDNFNYIDSDNLEKGIKIDFYPYIKSEVVTTNVSTYINETIYDSSLQVYCNSETQNPSICYKSQSGVVNSIRFGK